MIGRETHQVEIGGVCRELPLHEVAPGVTIALFDLLGVEAAVLVTAEAKSVPLAYGAAQVVQAVHGRSALGRHGLDHDAAAADADPSPLHQEPLVTDCYLLLSTREFVADADS